MSELTWSKPKIKLLSKIGAGGQREFKYGQTGQDKNLYLMQGACRKADPPIWYEMIVRHLHGYDLHQRFQLLAKRQLKGDWGSSIVIEHLPNDGSVPEELIGVLFGPGEARRVLNAVVSKPT